MNKKNLFLNCDVCDCRKMKEEDYRNYERITINADVVIHSEESKSAFHALPITMNSDATLLLPVDMEVAVKVANGSCELTQETTAAEHTVLVANGELRIAPGTEALLEKYEQIVVNGALLYPKSMKDLLTRIVANGPETAYPDGAILLNDQFLLDRYFPLRAGEGRIYYAKDAVIVKDESSELEKLAEKNVRFVTSRLIVPEHRLEACIPLVDEQVEFLPVPQGMRLFTEDTVLSEDLLTREGGRLFVYGNVTFAEEADMESLCRRLEKLIVKGTVTIPKSCEPLFAKVDAEYNELILETNARKISNVLKFTLDKELLQASPDGVEIKNAVHITLTEDIPPQLILEKLQIKNCMQITCSEAQTASVAAIATNTPQIGPETEIGEDSALGGMMHMAKNMDETKLINADSYIM